MGRLKRDWTDAQEKFENEGGRCRNCGRTSRVEKAHIAGREHDQPKPCWLCEGHGTLPTIVLSYEIRFHEAPATLTCPVCEGEGSETPGVLWVNPDDIIPLCGPATSTNTCHGRQHRGELDLLPVMKEHEQIRLVQLTGNIAQAFRIAAGNVDPDTYEEQSFARSDSWNELEF